MWRVVCWVLPVVVWAYVEGNAVSRWTVVVTCMLLGWLNCCKLEEAATTAAALSAAVRARGVRVTTYSCWRDGMYELQARARKGPFAK